ncbi:MAG: hypothetical protein GY953_14655 [bacterium]|nr:hypothetical protein [bacterium]
MYRVLLTAFLLAFTTVGCSSEAISKAVAPSIETISADELKQLMDSGEEFVLLDVRTKQEVVSNGTLEGYLHIPVTELSSRISEVPRDKLIIAACERGGRAGRAAVALEEAGYAKVKSFGFVEYRAKGYPLFYPK